MRFNLHARIEIAIAATLLLGSCGGSEFNSKFSDAERDEIADIASDVVSDEIVESDKVRSLESRIEELENKIGT